MKIKEINKKTKQLKDIPAGVPFRFCSEDHPSIYMAVSIHGVPKHPDKCTIVDLKTGCIFHDTLLSFWVSEVDGCFVEGYSDD